MQANTKRAKKAIDIRRGTKQNAVVKKKNLSQLVKPISSTIGYYLPYEEMDLNIILIKSIILFLKEKHPKELSRLKFDPEHNTIEDLLYSLIILSNSLNYIVDIPTGENVDENYDVRFLKPIDFDFSPLVIDLEDVKYVEKKQLRIGLVHLFKHISNCCSQTVLDACFDNMENHMFYCNELDYYSEGYLDEPENYSLTPKKALEQLSRAQMRFEKLLSNDISIFKNWNPRNEFDKKFKDFILEGLNLDFSAFYNLQDHSENVMPYTEWFFVMFDREKYELEQLFIQSQDSWANEGVSEPLRYWDVLKDTIIPINETDVDDFVLVCNYIYNIWDYLKKYYDAYNRRRAKRA